MNSELNIIILILTLLLFYRSVLESRSLDVRRSKPVNMPISKANAVLIESGSASSCEQRFLDAYHRAGEEIGSAGETRLKEDLADAMLESPGIRDAGIY